MTVENGWKENSELSIHRKNNDKDYCPENCIWANDIIQANEKTNNRNITAFGETKTMANWVRDPRCVVPYSALQSRLDKGKNPEEAIITPLKNKAD